MFPEVVRFIVVVLVEGYVSVLKLGSVVRLCAKSSTNSKTVV